MMTLGPTLYVQDSRGAVAFYCEAFHMTIGYHAFHPDGTYLHAELERGGCTIFAVSESSDAAILTVVVQIDFFHALRIVTQSRHDGVESVNQSGIAAHALALRLRGLALGFDAGLAFAGPPDSTALAALGTLAALAPGLAQR